MQTSSPSTIPFSFPTGNTGAVAATADPNLRTDTKRILVVDDSAFILKILSIKLKAAGYEVLTAEDGAEAVSIARIQRPDLIVLDMIFPPDVAHGGGIAWDGFLIMEWVRRLESGKDTPIIVISAGDPAKFKDRSLAAGAVAFFQKPLNHDELISTVRLALDARKTQPAGTVSK